MSCILVIDDDTALREMLRQMLEFVGYRTLDAPNGKVGIKLYRQEPIDLVITDLFMPEKEGIETIKELRDEFPNVKIIAISGGGFLGGVDYLYIAEKLGALRTFRKPFNLQEMLEAIREVLGEKG